MSVVLPVRVPIIPLTSRFDSSFLVGDTNCFIPSGGGPDPNECHVISDALLYNSQNIGLYLFILSNEPVHSYLAIGPLFNITTNAAVITMQFRSCLSFFVNQAGLDLTYCRTDWVSRELSFHSYRPI